MHKICKRHGQLTPEQIKLIPDKRYPGGGSLQCILCRSDNGKKVYYKNRDVHKKIIEGDGYKEEEINKFCKHHGELEFKNIKVEGSIRKCRLCMNQSTREYEKRYPERCASWRKEYDKRIGKELKRQRTIVSKHKISLDQYDSLLEKTGGLCAICGLKEKAKGRGGDLLSLGLDHCHECEENGFRNIDTIRGFLCMACNTGLGFFGDNIETMEKAINHLKSHKHVFDKHAE